MPEAVLEEANEVINGEGLAGKYLTFRLSVEEYGLEILKVREIIGLMEITIVPRTPNFIRGVINLRGKIIPVVDLRVKFAMASAQDTELTCIIVVDVNKDDEIVQMGILVDTVSEVLDIAGQSIELPPSFGSEVNSNFILGMAKIKDDVKILLNIEEVLNQAHQISLGESDEETAGGAGGRATSSESSKTNQASEAA